MEKEESMMNGRSYFLGGLYNCGCNFANLKHFMSVFGSRLENLPFDKNMVVTKLNEICDDLENVSNKIDANTARNLLVSRDIRKVLKWFESNDVESRSLYEARDIYVKELSNLGLSAEKCEIQVIDEFPKPFHKSTGAAICFDPMDSKRYGIREGIYFLKSRIRPYYTEALLGHEIIHYVAGQKNPDLFAMGLEEGICELMGSIYLTSASLGPTLTRNIFIYNRLSYGTAQLWTLYLQYLRQAYMLYLKFGLSGLAYMIDGGRQRIHGVEASSLLGDELINIPSGNYSEDLGKLLEYLLLTKPSDLVVSPLARYLADYIDDHDTVDKLSSKANMSKEDVASSLQELYTRLSLVLFDDNQVEYSNAKFISDIDAQSDVGIFRYDPRI